MPLPGIDETKRCTATCKARNDQCRNPAAYGMRVCRYHGAKKPETIRKGANHPQYRHGFETLEAKAAHLARELGMELVAEGVETTAQHEALLELGCDIGQGYLWGVPAPRMTDFVDVWAPSLSRSDRAPASVSCARAAMAGFGNNSRSGLD